MGTYILAALVVLAVWGLWWLIELPLLVPVLVTVVALVTVCTVIVIRWYVARRASRDLEKALADQAAQDAQAARPDAQAEIMEVKAEFEKAVSALKSSKLGRGKNALYALPWHIIIGPPGAGKTTALRNSGLHFPYLSARTGGAVRGLGGTRNCDWWFTNEAVILDTAGRWATEDQDREEWASFLDLLKRYRSRKPLNGIIVGVSVADLGNANEEQAVILAQKIRERVDEAMARLQMSLPLYVVFTKCDLIPGFVETFTNFSKNERGQVWGFTVPLEATLSAGQAFERGFDELVDVLDARMLRRLGEERKLDLREMVYFFPKQLSALRDVMQAFMTQLFELNVFRETPLLRGVYFTSGTQEGRPVDRVMQQMAAAFGLPGGLPVAAAPAELKSYFLRDVFQEVIFRDVDLAVRTEAEIRRRKRLRFASAAALFVLALLMFALPTAAWLGNLRLLSAVAGGLGAPAEPAEPGDIVPPEALAPLRQQLDQLEVYEQRVPLLLSFGMYQGSKVLPPLRTYGTAVLRRRVVESLFQQLQAELMAFDREYQSLDTAEPPIDQYGRAYDKLRTYLLLSAPKEAIEPPLADGLAEELTAALAPLWLAQSGVGRTGPAAEAATADLQRFTAGLAQDRGLAFPRDERLVDRVRSVLGRVSTMELAVDRLVQRFEGRGLDLTLDRVMGRAVPRMEAKRYVRAAFTRRVWEEYIRGYLEESVDRAAGEAWVMGVPDDAQGDQSFQEARRAAVQSRYLALYIEEWREFLRSIRVQPPQGNEEAYRYIQDLTRGQPTPLQRLFQQTHYNLTLRTRAEEEEEAATKNPGQGAVEKAAESGLLEAFKRRLRSPEAGKVAEAALEEARPGRGLSNKAGELTTADVGRAFEGFTRFGVAPAADPAEGLPPAVTGLNSYEEQLLFIRNALQRYFDNPNDPAVLEEPVGTARTTTRALIDVQEVGWRPVFEVVLWPPIDGASLSTGQAVAMGAGRLWCSEVVEPYMRTIHGRYPFAENAYDLSLADFGAFYQPEGTLWTFFNESLTNHITRQGDRFEPVQRFGERGQRMFLPALFSFLVRSRDITTTFFPPGSADPRVDFDVRIRPSPRVATQIVSVGGKTIEYHNGPELWQRLSWPGENPAGGAMIEIRGEGGMRERIQQEGEWGLFHLLEAGTVSTGASARVFTGVWRLRTQGVDITIDFRPVRMDSPFFGVQRREGSPRFLQPVRASSVRVPAEIVAGQRVCGR